MGGPRKLDRESDTPGAELLNRLKFGVEGAAFAGVIGGVGAGIGKLRHQTGTGKAIEGGLNKFFEGISKGLRARGGRNPNQFKLNMERKGGVDADLNLVERWRDEIDKFSKSQPYKKILKSL